MLSKAFFRGGSGNELSCMEAPSFWLSNSTVNFIQSLMSIMTTTPPRTGSYAERLIKSLLSIELAAACPAKTQIRHEKPFIPS